MNLKKLGRTFWVIAAVAIMAMVLQGCGGDDGVSPSTHMDVEDERDMYKARAEQLQALLGDETDPAPDSVRGMLAAAQADVTKYMTMASNLQTMLGDETDPAPDSVRGMLAAAQADVTKYMTLLGDETDPAPDSVRGMLAAAQADVTKYTNMANSLQMTLGDETDPAPDSVRGMLAAANALIGSDDDPDSLRGQIAMLTARVKALEEGTAPDVIKSIADDAGEAATEARTAATKADEYADQAEVDDDNRATIQTGDANSVAHAMYARAEADKADEEAGKADTAATMAAAATTTADANKYLRMATDAKEAAETARDEAKSHAGTAATDAMAELKINGSTKSVGDTSITVNRQSRTSADGRTITGLLSNMDITQAGMRDAMGHSIMAPTSATDSTLIPVTSGGNALVADTVDIGVTYDSADDDARLTLIHSYLGSKKEMLFIRNGDTTVTLGGPTPAPTSPFSAAPATTNITPEPPDPADTPDTLPTGSVVVPYADANAALGLPASGDGSLSAPTTATATRTADGVAGIPRMAGVIARAFDETEGTQPSLYYIDSGVTDNSVGANDDGIDQTRIFLERRVILNVVTYDVVFVRQVTLDDAMAFEHIHYGLWNGISGRDANTVSELGIGFVTALADGGGMTATGDMPNVGTLTYNGNWVANVQRAAPRGNGEISRQDGSATIMANVEDNEVDVTLAGLATLEGMIDGNMFSGTKATLVDSDTTTANVIDANYGLDGTGKFEGSFSGGFFGPRAAEAGGVFDFSTEDNHEGAFRGSFGGAR